jgi:hypothetical protein
VAGADLPRQPNLAHLALPKLGRACDGARDQRLRRCWHKETIYDVRKSITPHEKLFPLKGSAVRHNFAGGITGECCGAGSMGRVHQIVVEEAQLERYASNDLAVSKTIFREIQSPLTSRDSMATETQVEKSRAKLPVNTDRRLIVSSMMRRVLLVSFSQSSNDEYAIVTNKPEPGNSWMA